MITNTDLGPQDTTTFSRDKDRGPHSLPGINLLTALVEILSNEIIGEVP